MEAMENALPGFGRELSREQGLNDQNRGGVSHSLVSR